MRKATPITSRGFETPAPPDPVAISAEAAAAAIKSGETTSSALTQACLNRINARESIVNAWTFLDAERALKRASLADALVATSPPLGPLHGIPIGVKDVFDTCDMPSEYGSTLYRGRRPHDDADAVDVLRRAGAIIIGKTATSEFGMYHPSPTRNPHDPSLSPGVSSAGSAAAVADHMVPLALGTQHTASTLLPASFCGAFALKPSLGFTSMKGSNILAERLAQIGFLARSVGDLALFASAFDPALYPLSQLKRPPALAFVTGPSWSMVSPDAMDAFSDFLDLLNYPIPELPLPTSFNQAIEITLGLLNVHLAHRFGVLPGHEQAALCTPLLEGIAAGRDVDAPRYLAFVEAANRLTQDVDALFDGVDALVTLSTIGEAPRLDHGSGSGVMCMPWSLCGLPTMSLPFLRGAHGLPIGIQLIGQRRREYDLLRIANWLCTCIDSS
jgi:Asp-tRNA(Asn)/Glu-tRNA(Gln) amidotransferase A subunit family amidase